MRTHTQQIARQSDRIYVKLPVVLKVASEKEATSYPAVTIDLATGGAVIRVSARLSPGQDVMVVPDDGNGCSIPGRVVWVGPVGSNLEGRVGIEFLSPIGHL